MRGSVKVRLRRSGGGHVDTPRETASKGLGTSSTTSLLLAQVPLSNRMVRLLPLLESRLTLSWNAIVRPRTTLTGKTWSPSPIPFRQLFPTPRLSSRLIASRSPRTMLGADSGDILSESTVTLYSDPGFAFSHFPCWSGLWQSHCLPSLNQRILPRHPSLPFRIWNLGLLFCGLMGKNHLQALCLPLNPRSLQSPPSLTQHIPYKTVLPSPWPPGPFTPSTSLDRSPVTPAPAPVSSLTPQVSPSPLRSGGYIPPRSHILSTVARYEGPSSVSVTPATLLPPVVVRM